jgi:hypothetical protein
MPVVGDEGGSGEVAGMGGAAGIGGGAACGAAGRPESNAPLHGPSDSPPRSPVGTVAPGDRLGNGTP